MLLPSFFVIRSIQSIRLLSIKLPENANFLYKIDTGGDFSIEQLYKKLYTPLYTVPFAFWIDVDELTNQSDEVFEKNIDQIVPLTFHYKYIKHSYDNPLIVFESGRSDIDKYVTKTVKVFKTHGYDDVEIRTVQKSTGVIHSHSEGYFCFDAGLNTETFFQQYVDALKRSASASSPLFFLTDTDSVIPTLLDQIQNAEKLIQDEFPRIFFLLRENNSLMATQQELLFTIGSMKEKIDSLNSYYVSNQSDSTYKRQLVELLDFYKYEYDILPLWYKQMGHIIKVIMGKRTFKSLFSDKVKKYKK